MGWVIKTESPKATFESFRHNKGFHSLDAKLAAARTKIVTGELGSRTTLMVEQEASHKRMLKGRQILWMIHDNSKLDEERSALCDFTDLLAIRLKGDSQIESFMTTWESVLSALTDPPNIPSLRFCFSNSCDIRRFCVMTLPSVTARGKGRQNVPTPSW